MTLSGKRTGISRSLQLSSSERSRGYVAADAEGRSDLFGDPRATATSADGLVAAMCEEYDRIESQWRRAMELYSHPRRTQLRDSSTYQRRMIDEVGQQLITHR
jgi:hypothetical protein